MVDSSFSFSYLSFSRESPDASGQRTGDFHFFRLVPTLARQYDHTDFDVIHDIDVTPPPNSRRIAILGKDTDKIYRMYDNADYCDGEKQQGASRLPVPHMWNQTIKYTTYR